MCGKPASEPRTGVAARWLVEFSSSDRSLHVCVLQHLEIMTRSFVTYECACAERYICMRSGLQDCVRQLVRCKQSQCLLLLPVVVPIHTWGAMFRLWRAHTFATIYTNVFLCSSCRERRQTSQIRKCRTFYTLLRNLLRNLYGTFFGTLRNLFQTPTEPFSEGLRNLLEICAKPHVERIRYLSENILIWPLYQAWETQI
jgi:hypothetical protein